MSKFIIFISSFFFGFWFSLWFLSIHEEDVKLIHKINKHKEQCEKDLPRNLECKVIVVKPNEATEATNSYTK